MLLRVWRLRKVLILRNTYSVTRIRRFFVRFLQPGPKYGYSWLFENLGIFFPLRSKAAWEDRRDNTDHHSTGDSAQIENCFFYLCPSGYAWSLCNGLEKVHFFFQKRKVAWVYMRGTLTVIAHKSTFSQIYSKSCLAWVAMAFKALGVEFSVFNILSLTIPSISFIGGSIRSLMCVDCFKRYSF